MKATRREFGTMPDGRKVYAFTLENDNGMSCDVVEFGAILRTLNVPGRDKTYDVVLGQDDLDGVVNRGTYNAIIVGRHANRIAYGKFTIDGVEYQMETREGRTVCHSGRGNYGRRLFVGDCNATDERAMAVLHLHENGEGGLPGEADATVRYILTNDNALTVEYAISCTAPTPINPTNHAFFNMSGHECTSIDDLEVWFDSDFYLPVDPTELPTGEVFKVDGTPFDFRTPTKMGGYLAQVQDVEQLRLCRGYDHNMCINGRGFHKAASCYSEKSGVNMEVWTDLPGIHFYTANWPAKCVGKGGVDYQVQGSLCFETQFYPNASGYSQFPSNIFYPGETMRSKTSFKFNVK